MYKFIITPLVFLLSAIVLFVVNVFSPVFFLNYLTAGIIMYGVTGNVRISLLTVLVCYISMFLTTVFGVILDAANGKKVTLPGGRLDLKKEGKNED